MMNPDAIRDKVSVVGVGCCQFGENWDRSREDMMVDAVWEAYEDAGIEEFFYIPARVEMLARGQRDTQHVVHEREEQIAPDRAHRSARQLDCCHDGTHVAAFWGNQSVWPDHVSEARAIPGSD